jgi:hypothetical protein
VAGLALVLGAVSPASAQLPQRDPLDPLANSAGGALQQVSPIRSLNDPTRRQPIPNGPGRGPRFGNRGGVGFGSGFYGGNGGFGIYGGPYTYGYPVVVYNYGYPVYVPGGVYVERQVIVDPRLLNGYGTEGDARSVPDRDRPGSGEAEDAQRQPPAGRRDDFYLTRSKAEKLADAMADIRRAWLNEDFSRLRDRFPASSPVRIFPKGKYGYTMSGADFAQMTRDALASLHTTAFDFDPVDKPGADRAFVTGRHTFTAVDPQSGQNVSRTVYISYTLELHDGFWRITEAGSSPDPIRRHEE